MRGLLLALFVAAVSALSASAPSGDGARPATEQEIGLLNGVLHQTANDLRRWAYTEHRVFRDDKGRVKSDVLVRYDPSQPYEEQWTPLKIDGKEPSDRERAKYRRRGEQAAKQADPTKPVVQVGRGNSRRVTLGEVLDVPRSSIAAETATHWVFEIPLLKVGNERFPPEKFQVQARISKDGPRLENIAVRLRESFRSKLIFKVKSGEGSIDFALVDPKHPPTMVRISGDASASVLFVSVGGALELTRTELKHVRPFDERFDVQIGTLKAIDF